MTLPLAAFDIETIPDTTLGRELMGVGGSMREVADAMLAQRLVETEDRTDFLKPAYHRIVSISVAWLDPAGGAFKLDSVGEDDTDEGDLLEAFFRVLSVRPRLISWNGSSFDLPVIRYRAMLHGIDAGAYYDASDRFNNYMNRYHDLHTDLMDVLSGFGASARMGLDELCRIMGLPGKTVTEGHRVYQHIARGEWDVVKTYCELDALNTLMLYLAYDRSRGMLTAERFDSLRTVIAERLLADERPDVATYGEALSSWHPGVHRASLAMELDQPAASGDGG